MALMTPAEVITTAFTRSIAASQIKASDVEIAEFQYIRPLLTENLYNEIITNSGSYTAFITTYIKPCLAYFVKYISLENIFVEVSDRGMNHLNSDNATPISNSARTDYKTDVLNKANILSEKMVDYVQQQYNTANTLYSLYRNNQNVYEEDKFIAGFLITNNRNNEKNNSNIDGSNHERYLCSRGSY